MFPTLLLNFLIYMVAMLGHVALCTIAINRLQGSGIEYRWERVVKKFIYAGAFVGRVTNGTAVTNSNGDDGMTVLFA